MRTSGEASLAPTKNKIRTVFVGDGFIRPEVCTFVNLGRVTSINAERGSLGTDKSVPYKKAIRI
ncbi:MAG: hypothetical protein FWG87_10200 [Defluviitaleaceae bacterium]|nr:hypothetical protein [Defluviitaleaceae bacterium]